MKTIFIPILFFNLVFLSAGVSATELTADTIMTKINAVGPKMVIEKLWNSDENHPNDWDRLIEKIETGEKKWLDVATALKPASDAGSSEDLNGAMSVALLNNPVEVLTLLQTGPFTVNGVCTCPYVVETSDDEEIAYRYLNKAEKALSEMPQSEDNPHLDTVRHNCLKIIQGIKRGYYKSAVPDHWSPCEKKSRLEHDPEFQSLLRSIETGTDEALEKLKKMYPIKEPMKSGYLKRSLARALPQNPLGVLSMVEDGYVGIKEVCGAPYDEKKKLLQHLRITKKALRSQKLPVKDSRLADIMESCLNEVQSSIQALEKQ